MNIFKLFTKVNDPQTIRRQQLAKLRTMLVDAELEHDKNESDLFYINNAIKRLESQLEPSA
jgi:hypothetical protein